MTKILVYEDEGVSPCSLNQLLQALKEENLTPCTINASQIIHDDWDSQTDLLIFPGGRDIPYHQALSPRGTARIRQFVENGGCYFGICAGAYFGCGSFEFEKGSSLEIIAQRDLVFYPGKASGPAYGSHVFQYDTSEGARLASLRLPNANLVNVFYEGGCLFPNAELYKNIQIYARYSDLPETPAAIVICQIGEGKAILSGVHPEYSHELLDQEDKHLQQLVPAMKIAEHSRRHLFQSLLKEAFIDLEN